MKDSVRSSAYNHSHDSDGDFDIARPAGRFRCPYCQAGAIPKVETKITTLGWILCLILLPTFILWPIPLLALKEEYRRCRSCGMRLG